MAIQVGRQMVHELRSLAQMTHLHLLRGYPGQCPISEHAGDCLVRLPLFYTLSDADHERVIRAVTDFSP